MKNKKYILIPLFILIGACLLGFVYSVIDFKVINKTMSYSYQVIQFDFDGASEGVDPNGNPFDPIDFLTDDIISDGVKKSQLNCDVKDVKQYIVLENIVPEDIGEEINSYTSIIDTNSTQNIATNNYHPIRYRFVLYHNLDKKMSKKDLNSLLSNIVDSYCEHFFNAYKKSFDTEYYDNIYSMENYDYIYQVEVLTNKIKVLTNAARSTYLKHDSFSVNSKTFNDIYLKGNQLISSDVSRINNIIILNALSKDIGRLKDFYNYKIENLNYDKAKYTSDLNNLAIQLESYANIKDSTVYYIGSGENIVKVDSNANETYNKLISEQIRISNTIAKINTDINEYQNIVDDINEAILAGDSESALVVSYISKLEEDYNKLEETFRSMIEVYNQRYVLNGTISKGDITYHANTVFSVSFIVKCLKVCIPIALVVLLGTAVFYLVLEIKKNKTASVAA